MHSRTIFAPVLKKIFTYQRIIALVFLAAFFVQTFRNTFYVIDYYANTAKYARNCENKEKTVVVHCFGKCQIVKKIKEEQKKDDQNPNRKTENRDEVFSSHSFLCTIENVAVTIPKTYTLETNADTREMSFGFFHPPQA